MAERDYAVMLERAHLTAVASGQWREQQAQAQKSRRRPSKKTSPGWDLKN